nr:hypothetical protein [Clostridiales bacterium]
MRRVFAALLLLLFLVPAACLGEGEDFLMGVMPEPSEITPAYRSQDIPITEHENCYWCTPMDLSDEAAIWG